MQAQSSPDVFSRRLEAGVILKRGLTPVVVAKRLKSLSASIEEMNDAHTKFRQAAQAAFTQLVVHGIQAVRVGRRVTHRCQHNLSKLHPCWMSPPGR